MSEHRPRRERVVAIVGPTASGKARLAQEAARRAGATVLSCDSMKVYRGMDVGTAKPARQAQAEVRWLGLDVVEPGERFDASRWVELADAALAESRDKGTPLLVAGGTVLYLKSWTEGLFEGPQRDPAIRARLREEAERLGTAALHERLVKADPAAAAKIHPNDLRRVERALEVIELTGRPVSEQRAQWGAEPRFERVLFAVRRRRSDLDHRIDRRIDRMIAEGWVEECRALAARGGVSKEAAQALGYRELLDWIATGEREPLERVVERVKTLTRRFARKQESWLRNGLANVTWLDVPEDREPVELHLEEVARALAQQS
jgi:tRNA dimethylallyltransferase